MKMNIDEAKKILKEAGLVTESIKMSPSSNLEEFFGDLNSLLEQNGYGMESFDDFEEELEDAGYALLFTEETGDIDDDADLDALYYEIDGKIAKIKRKLSRKWTGFDIDSEGDEGEILVTLTVDGMGED